MEFTIEQLEEAYLAGEEVASDYELTLGLHPDEMWATKYWDIDIQYEKLKASFNVLLKHYQANQELPSGNTQTLP